MRILDYLLALIISYLVLGLLVFLFKRPVLNRLVDNFIKRLMVDAYPENLTEMLNVFSRVGLRNVLEIDLRGTSGQPLKRPFGAIRRLSPWEQLMFNPVYYTREPLEQEVPINQQVTIGKRAAKPLTIDLPVMVGAMAYGIGISKKSRLALAEATSRLNTATNAGVGPLLPEERRRAKKLILQYHRGTWGKDEETLRQADMIEIQLGYGALGSAPVHLLPEEISPEFRAYMELGADEGLALAARLAEARNGMALANLVRRIRRITGGVPVGVKIGATHWLEEELEIILRANPDFITIDGSEAGINFGPGILADDLGLPTLPALCRTVEFLKRKGLKEKISLIIGGGLFTPGDFLKALALGADAVYIGTAALLALAHTQLTKAIPWEPPTDLVYELGQRKNRLEKRVGAESVYNYLRSCQLEMELALRSLGKSSLAELSKTDLCALTPEVALMTGVECGVFPRAGKVQD